MSELLPYPRKVLLAWSEAISGNSKIRDWLIKNGYMELGIFCFALRNDSDARDWLLKNKFPHLMAFINAIEGNGRAVDWLAINGFPLLKDMALAADNNVRMMKRIEDNSEPEIILLTKKIQFVKNRIEADNENFHKFNNT